MSVGVDKEAPQSPGMAIPGPSGRYTPLAGAKRISSSGVEALPQNIENLPFSEKGAALSGAVQYPTDLARLIELWPNLPEDVRKRLLAMAERAADMVSPES